MRRILLALLAFAAACTGSATPHYEPAQSQLTGRIEAETDYGPPGFGRTPDEDERLLAIVLALESPITIAADPESDINTETLSGVRRIQLMRNDRNMDAALAGRRVRVTGRLFTPTTGQWVTPVAMQVERIEALDE